jgi:hypothetical protein
VFSTAYRQELIRAGFLRTSAAREAAISEGRSVLRLDDAGRRAALRHIEQGEKGARLMVFPQGLAPWHEMALATRERRAGT